MGVEERGVLRLQSLPSSAFFQTVSRGYFRELFQRWLTSAGVRLRVENERLQAYVSHRLPMSRSLLPFQVYTSIALKGNWIRFLRFPWHYRSMVYVLLHA